VITVGGLHDAQQRFEVKTVGYRGKFGNRSVEEVHAEQVRRAEDCESIERVVPEIVIASEGCERLQ
jgi:hypothetical protein